VVLKERKKENRRTEDKMKLNIRWDRKRMKWNGGRKHGKRVI